MDLMSFREILNDIEQNDAALDAHMSRVAMMAYELGREFGVRSLDGERLYVAGLLHEIGRYQLKTANLPGVNIVDVDKIYPLVSMATVSAHVGFDYVAKIIAQHAENIDGSGGPLGAIRDDIHVYATFVHIANFYDHMRMNGATHDETTAAIRENTNVIFPKKIITPFIKMLISNEDLQFDYNELQVGDEVVNG